MLQIMGVVFCYPKSFLALPSHSWFLLHVNYDHGRSLLNFHVVDGCNLFITRFFVVYFSFTCLTIC